MKKITEIYLDIEDSLNRFLREYVNQCDLDEDRGIDPQDFARDFTSRFLFNNSEQAETFEKEALEYAESYNNQGV